MCRPAADEGAESVAAIATAVRPDDWHLPNTEDEVDSEDFTQSALATVAIESIRINKEHINNVLEEESVDAHLLVEERGEVVNQEVEHDADALIGTPQLAPNWLPNHSSTILQPRVDLDRSRCLLLMGKTPMAGNLLEENSCW